MKAHVKPIRYLALGILAAFVLSLAAASDGWCAKKDYWKAPPPEPYKKVSSLVKLPDFIPGLGTLYVDPSTLPAGPFLAYDKKNRLVSTIYMIPLKDMNDRKDFKDLKVTHGKVDHVDILYNAGHPGVPEPHYHIILWYITPKDAEALK